MYRFGLNTTVTVINQTGSTEYEPIGSTFRPVMATIGQQQSNYDGDVAANFQSSAPIATLFTSSPIGVRAKQPENLVFYTDEPNAA